MINNSNQNYRPEIDGLRAISVIAVLVFHLNIIISDEMFLGGGFLGVDVFFVISGYLITNILIKEISKSNFKITNFFERRIRRIVPALFFMIICLSSITFVIFFPNDLFAYANSVIANSLFISNFFFLVS